MAVCGYLAPMPITAVTIATDGLEVATVFAVMATGKAKFLIV